MGGISIMQNFLMMLAAAGLLFTTLNSALYDMTLTACESQVGNYELACKEVNKWLYLCLLHVSQDVNAIQGQKYNALIAKT